MRGLYREILKTYYLNLKKKNNISMQCQMKIRIEGQKMNKWQYASNKQCISIVTQFLHVVFYIIWVKSISRL